MTFKKSTIRTTHLFNSCFISGTMINHRSVKKYTNNLKVKNDKMQTKVSEGRSGYIDIKLYSPQDRLVYL